jgi:phosphoglycolate phosphatase-like HAD superfamily hydrolase
MLKALADFQVGPADFLYVGDAYSDWTEGQKAGIKVLSALYFNKAEAGKLEKDNAGNTCLTVGELREKVFAFLGE